MAQENAKGSALLIIDVQEFYFPGGNMALTNPEDAAANTFKLITQFREAGNEIIYIKHLYEPGGDLYPLIKPLGSEIIFTKKEVNSFIGTGLQDYLIERNIGTLVICGMQTHMCVEAATRAAVDLGYQCTLVHDACATRDLVFEGKTVSAEDVHLATLATLKSYAKVVSTEEYLKGVEALKR